MFRRFVLAVVCAVLLFPTAAQAQEATEESIAEGFAFKWAAETIFPEGMQFLITALRPVTELQSAILMIEPEGERPVTVAVDVREPLLAEDTFTDLAYIWNMPPDMVLPLGTEVYFEWRVVAANGDQARVRDKAVFMDQRTAWTRSEDPQGVIHLTVPFNALPPDGLRQALRPVYALMVENTGRSETFDIMLYPADISADGCAVIAGEKVAVAPLGRAMLPCEGSRAALVFQASGLDAVQSQTGPNGTLVPVVALFLDRLYGPLWEGADIPDWFRTGLAEFYVPGVKVSYLGSLQRAARTGGLTSLARPASGTWNEQTWRAQSYASVLYIADLIGVDGLFVLAREASAAGSFEEVYQELTGQPLETLLPNMRRWLLTPQGERAFAYVPYQGSTPTPFPSPTPTATRTPSATPSLTLTLTPSVTGVLTSTPTATRTSTRTPTPGPPSVTPRPPGSLDTPTPTPSPVVGGLADSDTRTGIMIVLAVALVAVGGIYLYAGRRR